MRSVAGFKELTSLLTTLLNFEEDGLIPIASLNAIVEVNKSKDALLAFSVAQKMPMLNFMNLMYLCVFWYGISKYASVNKMTIGNICTCVGPSLIRAKEWGCGGGLRRSTSQFLTIVSPIYPFVNQLILSTQQVDLESIQLHMMI